MTEAAQLSDSRGKGSDDFGFSTAIRGNTAVIGAVNAAGSKGAAYVYANHPRDGAA